MSFENCSEALRIKHLERIPATVNTLSPSSLPERVLEALPSCDVFTRLSFFFFADCSRELGVAGTVRFDFSDEADLDGAFPAVVSLGIVELM